MKYSTFQLPVFKDERGPLCTIEWSALPFPPKRAYFIYEVKGMRGAHAHKKEKEVFVCMRGNFTARIHDGKSWKIFKMTKPGQALYNAHMVWHEFTKFSKNGIMLAISSTPYRGKNEYVLDFEQFKILCKKKSS